MTVLMVTGELGRSSFDGAGEGPGRARMVRIGKTMAVVLALTVGACATTKFKSTWKDPSVSRLDVAGKRVVGFVVTKTESLRRSAEDALVKELQKRGVQAVAGYQVV